jgi:hypothetical protein
MAHTPCLPHPHPCPLSASLSSSSTSSCVRVVPHHCPLPILSLFSSPLLSLVLVLAPSLFPVLVFPCHCPLSSFVVLRCHPCPSSPLSLPLVFVHPSPCLVLPLCSPLRHHLFSRCPASSLFPRPCCPLYPLVVGPSPCHHLSLYLILPCLPHPSSPLSSPLLSSCVLVVCCPCLFVVPRHP